MRRLDDDERGEVEAAYEAYLETIPEIKRQHSVSYAVKDVVGRSGFGIGSAGLPAYNLLIEGRSQALENDVVLSMKQGNVAAPSRVVDDPAIAGYFEHQGHRTAVSQRALQAHADPWLGWTELRGVGQVVAELSPVRGRPGLGRADRARRDPAAAVRPRPRDREGPLRLATRAADQTLVPFQTEEAITDVVDGREEEFVARPRARSARPTARSRATTTAASSTRSATARSRVLPTELAPLGAAGAFQRSDSPPATSSRSRPPAANAAVTSRCSVSVPSREPSALVDRRAARRRPARRRTARRRAARSARSVSRSGGTGSSLQADLHDALVGAQRDGVDRDARAGAPRARPRAGRGRSVVLPSESSTIAAGGRSRLARAVAADRVDGLLQRVAGRGARAGLQAVDRAS